MLNARVTRWTSTLLVLTAVSSLAIAHDWIDLRKPEGKGLLEHGAPSQAEAAAGFTGVYRVTLEAGQSFTLAIKDTQACDAKIDVESVTGSAAKVKAVGGGGLVRDRFVSIKAGKKPGVTEATIPVRGEDLVNGTSGVCKEDSKNKLVVTVVESGDAAVREFGAEWRPHSLMLRSDIRTNVRTAQTEIRSHFGALKTGQVDVETAVMGIYTSAHWALVNNQDDISSVLSEYRGVGVGILSDGGFSPNCEPRGFGSGSGGPWDAALRDTYLQGFGGLQSLDKIMLGARKEFDKLTDSGKFNVQMTHQPGYFLLPAYAPPSQNPAPGTKSVNDLQIQLYGGVTYQNDRDVMEGCLWFGGRYDPAKGAPTATLTDPFGTKITKTPFETSTGAWAVQYLDLAPGLTYRVDLSYADKSEQDSCALSLPWLDAVDLK